MSSCVFNLDKYNNLKSCAFWCNYNNYEYLDDIKHNSKKDYEDWVKFPCYFNITAKGDALYDQGDRGCKNLKQILSKNLYNTNKRNRLQKIPSMRLAGNRVRHRQYGVNKMSVNKMSARCQ